MESLPPFPSSFALELALKWYHTIDSTISSLSRNFHPYKIKLRKKKGSKNSRLLACAFLLGIFRGSSPVLSYAWNNFPVHCFPFFLCVSTRCRHLATLLWVYADPVEAVGKRRGHELMLKARVCWFFRYLLGQLIYVMPPVLFSYKVLVLAPGPWGSRIWVLFSFSFLLYRKITLIS